MKITIEVDGATVSANNGAASAPLTEMSVEAAPANSLPINGGAGPGDVTPPAPTVTGDEADGGGPAQALLDAVGAAERDAAGGAGLEATAAPAGETDAGAGPAGIS